LEKTIEIDGKQIRFKSSGATAIRYKMQFRKDYFAEILRLNTLGKLNIENMDPDALDKLDFEVFYNIAWTLAKTADSTIPDPFTWLDEFEQFPIFDFIEVIQDMLIATIQSKKKI